MKITRYIVMIAVAMVLAVASVLWYSFRTKYTVIGLNKEPDSISCCDYTNELYVVTDGALVVCNENGNTRTVEYEDIYIKQAYAGQSERWILDSKNDLYRTNDEFCLPELFVSGVEYFDCNSGGYAAITTDNKLFVWGENPNYFLGAGEQNIIAEPYLVESISNPEKVSIGYQNTLLLDENGNVYECGLIDKEYVDGEWVDVYSYTFRKIDGLSEISDIESGYGNIASDKEGRMHYWIRGYSSEQQDPYLDEISRQCSEMRFKSVFAGIRYNVCVDDNGDVYYWGWDFINKTEGKEVLYSYELTKIRKVHNADTVYACNEVAFVKSGSQITVVKEL